MPGSPGVSDRRPDISAMPVPPPTHRSQSSAHRLASMVARGMGRTLSNGGAPAPPQPGAPLQPPPADSESVPCSSNSSSSNGSLSSSSSLGDSLAGLTHDDSDNRAPKHSRSRTLLAKLWHPSQRHDKFTTAASSDDSAFSSGESPGSPEVSDADTRQQQVTALVSEYMSLPDRREHGFVDASHMRRRLGVGRRREEKCELYYEIYGSGPKRMFLIMGMIGSTMFWRLQTRYFANLGNYTVCVFDNRGSGRSTITPGPYKVSRMAKDALKVLDHLGWHEDVHMAGISLGGMIAQELCLLNNETAETVRPRFASVAFVDTWHSSSLAVPTVKEIKFAFNGMAALGDDPSHLIDLVFPRHWVHHRFHDSLKEAQRRATTAAADDDSRTSSPDAASPGDELTNKEVLTAFFRAIQDDLCIRRAEDNARRRVQAELPTSPPACPQSAGDIHDKPAVLAYARTSPVADNDEQIQEMLERQSHAADDDKQSASGDVHQFMACLGHQLSTRRVREIRTRNPHTRFVVVHGEKDRVIRPHCGRDIAKHLGCAIVWIPGAGHMLSIDAHCTFNFVLRAIVRNDRWIHEIPDRARLTPASWEEQVRVRRWMTSLTSADHKHMPPAVHRHISLHLGLPSADAKLCSDAEPGLESEQEPSDVADREGRRGRRRSHIEDIHLLGPLPQELVFIDDSDADVPPRIIPASTTAQEPSESATPASAGTPKTSRDMVVYGALLDAPIRVRHYSHHTSGDVDH